MKKVSYKPLWKLLIDKNMKKKDLKHAAQLSASTMNKLNHDKNITVDVLLRICDALNCDFKDIMVCQDREDIDEQI